MSFTDYLNTESLTCFVADGLYCFCPDCGSRRVNTPSTAQAGFDIGPDIHHTSANVGNNSPESFLGDSQSFATRNANSFGYPAFVSNAFPTPFQLAQNPGEP
jgi:hypothetical protein